MGLGVESELDQHGAQLSSDEAAGADVVDVVGGPDRLAPAQHRSRVVAVERSELCGHAEPHRVRRAHHRDVGQTKPPIDDLTGAHEVAAEQMPQRVDDAEAHGVVRNGEEFGQLVPLHDRITGGVERTGEHLPERVREQNRETSSVGGDVGGRRGLGRGAGQRPLPGHLHVQRRRTVDARLLVGLGQRVAQPCQLFVPLVAPPELQAPQLCPGQARIDPLTLGVGCLDRALDHHLRRFEVSVVGVRPGELDQIGGGRVLDCSDQPARQRILPPAQRNRCAETSGAIVDPALRIEHPFAEAGGVDTVIGTDRRRQLRVEPPRFLADQLAPDDFGIQRVVDDARVTGDELRSFEPLERCEIEP